MNEKKYMQITFSLPKELDELLEEFSEQRCSSKGSSLRFILKEALRK
jgi:predicted DNA-binding protein